MAGQVTAPERSDNALAPAAEVSAGGSSKLNTAQPETCPDRNGLTE